MASNAPVESNDTLQPMDAPPAAAAAITSTSGGAPPSLPNDILLQPAAADAAETAVNTPGSDAPLTAEQRSLSLKVSLADLAARASHHYAQKNYEDAAEVYAQAAEMQAEMNGEMSPENAEILFLYGRSLFKVGQAKSDVLGGRAPAVETQAQGQGQGEKKRGRKRKVKAEAAAAAGESSKKAEDESAAAAAAAAGAEEKVVQEVAGLAVEEGRNEGKKELEGKKPLFQFTGDENWDDSDDGDGDDAGEGEGEEDDEEDDDLATAFEVLDLARLLLRQKLDEKLGALEASEGKGKEVANGHSEDAEIRHIKERLADTHYLLAEIQLENERYPAAIADTRASLQYQQELLPEDHEIVAEAHYKLSLALEFASITSQQDEEGAAPGAAAKEINQELRDEAVKELEAAIASTKMKLHNKEVELATLHNPEDNEISRKQIAEMKEIIADMEQRLTDLRGPPIDMQAALGVESLGGILGAALSGEPAAQTEARIEEAKKTATDLTGLVRKKGKPAPATAPAAAAAAAAEAEASNGKRKAEDDIVMADGEANKKSRTDETSA
ncbi:unnamed protein product [Discula destructiva]